MNNDFYVVLPSNSCPLTRPNNIANEFTVDYETPFKLSGRWEVALMEFNCIYSSKSVEGESRIRFEKREKKSDLFYLDYEDAKLNILISESSFKIELTSEKHIKFSSDKHFSLLFDHAATAINLGFPIEKIGSKDNILIGNKVLEDDISGIAGIIEFDEYINVQDSIKFTEDMIFNTVNDLRIFFEEYGGQVFKEIKIDQNNHVNFKIKDHVLKIEIDNKLATLLGFSKTVFTEKWLHVADKKPKLKTSFDHMYIYSSIVEPIYVGSDRVPLLKNIWLENKNEYIYGDLVYLAIDQPMYLPVNETNINKIEINIRDDSGKLINFSSGSKTSLTLHFRHRNG